MSLVDNKQYVYDKCACGNRKRTTSQRCRECFYRDNPKRGHPYQVEMNGEHWRYDVCGCGNKKDRRVRKCRDCYRKTLNYLETGKQADVTQYRKTPRSNDEEETVQAVVQLGTNSDEHIAVRELLDSRDTIRSAAARELLLDWIVLMQEERKRFKLEEEQAVILVHALRDVIYERASYYLVWAMVDRYLRANPHPSINHEEFVGWLRDLRPCEAAAVVDGVRTFWLYRERYGKMTFRDSLYDVGLVNYLPEGWEED